MVHPEMALYNGENDRKPCRKCLRKQYSSGICPIYNLVTVYDCTSYVMHIQCVLHVSCMSCAFTTCFWKTCCINVPFLKHILMPPMFFKIHRSMLIWGRHPLFTSPSFGHVTPAPQKKSPIDSGFSSDIFAYQREKKLNPKKK